MKIVTADFNMETEFFKTTKGANKLLHEGFLYVKQKTLANGWTAFECERRRNWKTCKGKVKVLGDEVVVLSNHTHGPDNARGEALKAVQNMKERAETTGDAPQRILTQNVQHLTPAASTQLPIVDSVRRNIRRFRQKAGNPLPVPQTREEIPHPIPEEYRTTENGEEFLLYDSNDEDRILIFGTAHGLQVLEGSEHWLMDGTFKTVPPLYLQMYTIHALVQDRVVPALYALLPNKQLETYRRLFAAMLRLNMDLAPSTVLLDFEQAAKVCINSFIMLHVQCALTHSYVYEVHL